MHLPFGLCHARVGYLRWPTVEGVSKARLSTAIGQRAASNAAADNEMSQEYLTCIDKSNGVTSEMLDCISAELMRQDARLNENYKRLMSKLSAKRKEGLREAQRAWVKFRDANCGFFALRWTSTRANAMP
jgi:uncharacterized protein YecT (DUF1311 family)